MTERSGPWGTSSEDAGTFYQGDWRRLMRGLMADGCIGDPDGDSLKVTATGGSTQLQVAPGAHFIQGALYVNDADVTLDLDAFGTLPTSGQTRIDLVILKYDPTAQTVVATIKAGAPASSGATEPSLTRSDTGVWEHRLAKVTRVGDVAVNASMIDHRRTWTTPGVYTPYMDPLSNAPIGSWAVTLDDIQRRGTADGDAAWISILDPEWSTLTTAAGVASSVPLAKWRKRGGMVEVTGTVVKSSGSWSSGDTAHVGTIPTQGRPSADVFGVVACSGGGAVTARAIIYAATGRIEINIPASGTNAVGLNGLSWDI